MGAFVTCDVNPLNATLHSLLEHKFGTVKIANAGVRASVERFRDPIHPGRYVTRSANWGEYYCINCPFCNDVDHKLWVNHMYGAAVDSNTGRRSDTFLAVCYKNDCVRSRRQQFEDLVFGPGKPIAQRVPIAAGVTQDTATTIDPPGEIVSLRDLPSFHPAVEYLQSRQFDPTTLAERYGVGVCVNPPPKYDIMRGRIYIPAYMHGQLLAWQGRVVSPPDAKPKYYTQGYKSRVLYNYAAAAREPYLIVVEGVPSVWRLAAPAVAIFGKSLSQWQQNTIGTTWSGKTVFLVLDYGAEAELEKMTMQLYRYLVEVVPVVMPDTRDPAEYELPEFYTMLRSTAAMLNIDASFLPIDL